MQWILANLLVLSVILVIAAAMWVYGAVMWYFGLPPDRHPPLNVLGALLALGCGFLYAKYMIGLLNRSKYG